MSQPAASMSTAAASSATDRPSDSASLLLTRLHEVEARTVLHYLPRRELLHFARCNRTTLRLASHDYAWKTHSPLLVYMPWGCLQAGNPNHRQEQERQLTEAPKQAQQTGRARVKDKQLSTIDALLSSSQLSSQLSSSLLRHCDVRALWAGSRSDPRMSKPLSGGEVAFIAGMPRLRVLDTRDRTLTHSELLRIVSLNAVSGLTELHLSPHVEVSAECTEAIVTRLTHLRALSLHYTGASPLLLSVPRMPSLASLHAVRIRGGPTDTALCIGECRHLRALSLHDPHTSTLQPVLTCPRLKELEELTLSSICARHANGDDRPAAPIDWPGVFANLRWLSRLTLSDVWGVAEVLAALTRHASPHLTHLRVDASRLARREAGDWAIDRQGEQLPDVHTLRTLIDSLPQVRSLHLRLPSLAAYRSASELRNCTDKPSDVRRTAASQHQRACETLQDLAARFPDVVTLEVEADDCASVSDSTFVDVRAAYAYVEPPEHDWNSGSWPAQ